MSDGYDHELNTTGPGGANTGTNRANQRIKKGVMNYESFSKATVGKPALPVYGDSLQKPEDERDGNFYGSGYKTFVHQNGEG